MCNLRDQTHPLPEKTHECKLQAVVVLNDKKKKNKKTFIDPTVGKVA